METIKNILEYQFFEFSIGEREISLSVLEVITVIVIFLITRAGIWVLRRALQQRVNANKLDPGKSYAISQIITYLLWVIAIVYSLDYMGMKITVLLAGSTALFVGLGLGLQDVFKDFVSGFIILMDRAVTVGDIIEADGIIGEVEEVGLRTTVIKTRDDIHMILPNQRLTNQAVINWSQGNKVTRFNIQVGVAYGSDTRKVEKLLIEAVLENDMVSKTPEPVVHFIDFGDNSLNFKVNFYSKSLFRIELVKSEIRYNIDQKFRENGIAIPFPQRDLWVKQWPAGSDTPPTQDHKKDKE